MRPAAKRMSHDRRMRNKAATGIERSGMVTIIVAIAVPAMIMGAADHDIDCEKRHDRATDIIRLIASITAVNNHSISPSKCDIVIPARRNA
jgi:hypothetical protein